MSEVQSKTDEEAIKEFLNGQREADSLTEEQLDLALTGDYTLEEEPETEQEEELSIPEAEGAEAPKEPLPIEQDIPEFDKHKEYREVLAKANKFEQLYKDREDKLEKMKKDPEFAQKQLGIKKEVKVDENVDYLDDKYLAALRQELDELKEWKSEYEKEIVQTRQEAERQKEQLGIFSEIQDVQAEYPSLKTSESFKSIDGKYTAWQANLVSAGLSPDRYLNEKEYKAALDAKGYKLDVKDADIPKMLDVYAVYGEYKKEKESGYSTSFKRALRASDVFDKVVKSKYSARVDGDDDALNRAIEDRSSEPVFIDSSSNTQSSIDLGDVIGELEILSNKTQKSPADRKRIDELDKLIEQYF